MTPRQNKFVAAPLIAVFFGIGAAPASALPRLRETEAAPPGFSDVDLTERQSRAETMLESMNFLANGLPAPPLPAEVPVPALETPAFVEETFIATPDGYAPTNDPLYDQMWWLQNTRAYQAWDLSRGAGTTIAFIDSGLDSTHPDIDGNIWTNVPEANGLPGVDDDGNGYTDDVHGWDFYLENNDFSDALGHGTHTAGIAAAEGNNGTGVVGFAPQAKIMSLKVFKPNGNASLPDVVQAIYYAADMGADVINMSLGFFTSSLAASDVTSLQNAVDYAIARGIAVIVSAGNQGGDTSQRLPAGFSQVITVGATISSNQPASFSNFGPGLDWTAPGNDILSLSIGGGYAYASGTSMSASMVSGTVALLLAQDPTLNLAGIERRLRYSAQDLGISGFDNTYGWGLLDAFKALSYDYYDGGLVKTHWLASPDASGAVRYDYDIFGRAVHIDLANGGYRTTEYWLDTLNPYVETDHAADGSVLVTRRFYENSGVRRSETFADGSVIDYFRTGFRDSWDNNADGSFSEYANENFYGNGIGRLIRRTRADGSFTRYEGYWDGTDKPRVLSEYSAAGVLLDRSEYDLSGNPITASSAPVLTQALNPLQYASVSGTVYNYSGKLVFYSNRSVTYNFNASQGGDYQLKLSTAQATSKNTPSAAYKFLFNILVDGQVKLSGVELSAAKTYTLSDFLALGNLASGNHTLTLQWTNDQLGSGYDTNAGIGAVEVYRGQPTAGAPPPSCSGDACEFDAQGKEKKIFYADGRYSFLQYDGAGNPTGRTDYDSSGNPIGVPPPPPAAPVLTQSLSPMSYASVSGVVYNYSGKLVMYSNRSVTYNFNASQGGDYQLKLSTAQATSKNTPSAAYKFLFNILVDGQVKLSGVELSAAKTYTLSDFLALGNLASGNHTLTLQWTNDQLGSGYDTNAGIGAVEIYRT